MTTYSIGQAAERCGLTRHTLRWYERIGLLDRVPRGSDGRRRFGDEDLKWLELLVHLRDTGMPVAEMLRYAELVRQGPATHPDRAALLIEHRDRVRAEIATLSEHLAVLDLKIAAYSGVEPETREKTA